MTRQLSHHHHHHRSRRRYAAAAALLGLATSAAGSLLFACVGTDADPSPTTPGLDAAQEAQATSDSSSSSSDATDAEAADVADGGTFCDQFPKNSSTACEDFEHGPTELHGWTHDLRPDGGDGGGAIDIVAIDGPSGPSFVGRMTLAAHDTSGPTGSTRLTQNVTTSATTNFWTIEGDVRLKERAAPLGDVSILGFFYDSSATKLAALYLTDQLTPNDKSAQPFADLADAGLGMGQSFVIAVNVWVHLVMQIERQTTLAKLTIKVNNVEVSSISGLPLPDLQHKINIGPVTQSTSGPVTLEIDNFVFHAEP